MTTTAEIDAAILRELAPTGDRLVCWTQIHPRVPGSFWEKQAALLRMHWAGLVYHMRIAGTPYVSLGDETDRQVAAKARAEGRVRDIRDI